MQLVGSRRIPKRCVACPSLTVRSGFECWLPAGHEAGVIRIKVARAAIVGSLLLKFVKGKPKLRTVKAFLLLAGAALLCACEYEAGSALSWGTSSQNHRISRMKIRCPEGTRLSSERGPPIAVCKDETESYCFQDKELLSHVKGAPLRGCKKPNGKRHGPWLEETREGYWKGVYYDDRRQGTWNLHGPQKTILQSKHYATHGQFAKGWADSK